MLRPKRLLPWALLGLLLATTALAEDATVTAETVQTNLNCGWTMVAASLVFFMRAGLAMVEAGFARARNACDVRMRNSKTVMGIRLTEKEELTGCAFSEHGLSAYPEFLCPEIVSSRHPARGPTGRPVSAGVGALVQNNA